MAREAAAHTLALPPPLLLLLLLLLCCCRHLGGSSVADGKMQSITAPPPIFALHPATAAPGEIYRKSELSGDDDGSDAVFVLRAARQLRLSM
eukprot:SAG31_NODE_2008_length_6673_cov_3.990265_1_plen_92_part_00